MIRTKISNRFVIRLTKIPSDTTIRSESKKGLGIALVGIPTNNQNDISSMMRKENKKGLGIALVEVLSNLTVSLRFYTSDYLSVPSQRGSRRAAILQ